MTHLIHVPLQHPETTPMTYRLWPSDASTWATLAIASAFLSAPATAQQTLIVDVTNGPGTDETSIQPAIDRSSPGDLVLVRPGQYASFVLTAGIRVVGQPGARIGSFFPLPIEGNVTIENVPVGQTAHVAGFSVFGNHMVRNCFGTVAIAGTGSGSSTVEVRDCIDVRVKTVSINSMTIDRSSCSVENASGSTPANFLALVQIDDSTVTMTDSTIVAAGSMGTVAPAVSVENSALFVQDSTLTAGGFIGAASAVVGNGTVHIARTATNGVNAPGLAASLSVNPTDFATTRTTTPAVGGVLNVEVEGVPGYGFAPIFGLPTPPVSIGLGHALATAPIISVPVGLLPPTGLASVAFPVPNVPSLVGTVSSWQTLAFDPAAIAATLSLSNASTQTIAP